MDTLVQQRTTIDRRVLLDAGFIDDQIEVLEAMRGSYPYLEFLDSRQELERLRFMKWMILNQHRPAS